MARSAFGSTCTDADWIKTIRHGVRPDATSSLLMPLQNLGQMNDADLGAIIAHLKTMPAVDNTLPTSD